MSSQKAGRPAKPDESKRQQLHISLYAEDLERLDRLTDNRSEFLRQCIAKAWDEQSEKEAMLSVALSQSLVRELRKIVEQLDPRGKPLSKPLGKPRSKPRRKQMTTYKMLAARLKE